jgi:hypothetical protein
MANFIKKFRFTKKAKHWINKLKEIEDKHNEYRKLRFQKMLDQDEMEYQTYNNLIDAWNNLWGSNVPLKEKEKYSNELYDVYINTINDCIQRVNAGQDA